jgi:hypothetical protein
MQVVSVLGLSPLRTSLGLPWWVGPLFFLGGLKWKRHRKTFWWSSAQPSNVSLARAYLWCGFCYYLITPVTSTYDWNCCLTTRLSSGVNGWHTHLGRKFNTWLRCGCAICRFATSRHLWRPAVFQLGIHNCLLLIGTGYRPLLTGSSWTQIDKSNFSVQYSSTIYNWFIYIPFKFVWSNLDFSHDELVLTKSTCNIPLLKQRQ